MKSPSETVLAYIHEMYEWETSAAADLNFEAMDLGCPLDLDPVVLESKFSSFSEPDPSIYGEYRRIAKTYLTQRHSSIQMDGYGSPPRHDPDLEEIVGDPIVLDDEAHVNTRVNDFCDLQTERFYRLKLADGDWRIDRITEKLSGEYFDLVG